MSTIPSGAVLANGGDGVWGAAGILGSPDGCSLLSDTGAVTDQDLQVLAVLQQQDAKLADVDATIQQLLDIKQQVLAMRQPVLSLAAAAAAPSATAVPLWPDMSAQQGLCAAALPTSCTASSSSFVQQSLQQPQLGPTRSTGLNNGQQQQGQLVLQQQFMAPVARSSCLVPTGAVQQQQGQLVAVQAELLQMLRLS
jgi:hypothetical protein